jgi:hypothetical protein
MEKEEQKQHLINMMRDDENLGLYEEPKQETLEEAANTYFETLPEPYNEYLSNPKNGFIAGAKWQQEQDERTCKHNYTLTDEQGHRVIKCGKCNDTRTI